MEIDPNNPPEDAATLQYPVASLLKENIWHGFAGLLPSFCILKHALADLRTPVPGLDIFPIWLHGCRRYLIWSESQQQGESA